MCCITTVTYSVLINGVAQGCIVPTRGLRPLSSYLFLLCANDFSSFIYGAVRNKANSGIFICKGCLMITHLFFADDSVLFCKASGQECQALNKILELYEAASSKKINTNKSFVFFSYNTPNNTKKEVLDILGPMQDSRHSKYLGLPSIIRKSKKEVFAEVKKE